MKLIPSILFALLSDVGSGQNWMMAEKYLTSAIDSLIQTNWPNTGKSTGYSISHIEYDEILDDFIIIFSDTISCSKQDLTLKNVISFFMRFEVMMMLFILINITATFNGKI